MPAAPAPAPELDPDRPITPAEVAELAALFDDPELRRRNAHAVALLTWEAPPREPGDPVSFPLPDPCPRCGGLVVYIGRGARPVFCGPDCRAAHDAATRPERRAEGLDLAARAARQETERRAENGLDVYAGSGSIVPLARTTRRRTTDLDPGAAEHDDDGFEALPEDWSSRSQARRETDPAVLWLREHHPEAVADFPRALHVGRTAESTP